MNYRFVMRSRTLRLAAFLATLAMCGPVECVRAQDQRLRDMRNTTWKVSDGAPRGITHLAQDPDGSLWIGSESGLVNFDGLTFRLFRSPDREPTLPADTVNALLMTSGGTLWVSFDKVLARIAADHVVLYDAVDATPLGSVEQLNEAPDRTIWAIDSRRRLIRYGSDGRWRGEPTPTPGPIGGLFVDSANTVWLAQGGFLYTRSPSQTAFVRTEVGADVVTGFAETPNHEIWMNDHDATTSRARMQQISPAGRLIRTHAQALPDSRTLLATADGSLIVTSVFYGVRRLSADELHAALPVRTQLDADTFASTLISHGARVVKIDTHGNIWIGGALGLDRLSPARLTRFLPGQDKGTWGICSTARGDVVLGNAAGELYLASGPTPTRLPGSAADPWGFACADVGRVWFEDRRGGIWSIVGGRATALPPIPDARRPDYTKMVATADTLYATVMGTSEQGGGVWRYRDGRWTRLLQDGELSAGGLTVYVDHHDRLWIGRTRGRAILYRGGRAQVVSSGTPGLGQVHAFLDTSHGLLASGTNGLAVLRDSQFDMLTYAEPSIVRGVRGMVEAANGDLWLNAANGFVHIANTEIAAGIASPTHPMRATLVREGEQVRTLGPHSQWIVYGEAAARDREGYLWFSVFRGNRQEIVRLDPKAGNVTHDPPTITIRSIVGDGQPLPRDRRLAPTTRTVNIQYFGVNLTAPESVVYRYRLEGFDRTWQEAGRRTEAFYTSLPPGTYSFAVIASSSDGIWTDPVSTAPFTVLPKFYQTWWFAAAMAALTLLMVWSIHRLRVRQIARVMNLRFDERLAERTRVARELHDTLLQTVHGSKLVADRALRDTADRGRLVQALEQLSAWLGQAATEGRAALQSLRASTIENNDLAAALRRANDECRSDSTAELSLAVQGHPREFHPVVRDEIYRIGYEAIRNACVHARASRIDVALEYGHDLALRISDDGIGMDASLIETGKDGHFGLRGMRERAERIGAEFALVSGPGTGTRITLVVPGRIAFTSPRASIIRDNSAS